MIMLPGVTNVSVSKKFCYDLVKNLVKNRSIFGAACCYNPRGYVPTNTVHSLHRKQKVLWQLTASNLCTVIDEKKLPAQEITALEFEKVSEETLESLTDYFDEVVEQARHLSDADVAYRDGVLTVSLGNEYGTYVINRQTPNKQIWLSSPTSGPKRYDYFNGKWIYKHDGVSLHELLDNEISLIVKRQTSFTTCSYGGK